MKKSNSKNKKSSIKNKTKPTAQVKRVTLKAKRSSTPEEFQSIFSQLKSEHDQLKDLLKKTENSEPSQRAEHFSEVLNHLIPHARGEEKTLYALFRIKAQDDSEDSLDLANEGYEEHLAADTLIEMLKQVDVSSERWIPLFKVLKENLEHHIREEENEIFKKCKKLISKQELQSVLEAYKIAKAQFETELPAQGDIAERAPSEELVSILGG